MALPATSQEEPVPLTRMKTRSQTKINNNNQPSNMSLSDISPSTQNQKPGAKPLVKPASQSAAKSSAKAAKAKPLSSAQVEQYIHDVFVQRYHDANGKLKQVPETTTFILELQKELPGHSDIISRVVKSINDKLANTRIPQKDFLSLLAQAQQECNKISWTDSTREHDRAVVIETLAKQNPNIHRTKIDLTLRKAEELQRPSGSMASGTSTTKEMLAQSVPATTPANSAPEAKSLDQWVYDQFELHGFKNSGFRGYKWLTSYLQIQKPGQALQISQSVKKLQNDLKAQGRDVNEMALKRKADLQNKAEIKQTRSETETAKTATKTAPDVFSGKADEVAATKSQPSINNEKTPDDLLAKKMKQFHSSDKLNLGLENKEDRHRQDYDDGVDGGIATNSADTPAFVDHNDMNALLSDSDTEDHDDVTDEFDAEIRHAPLLDEDFISDDTRHLVPQYGLIGSHNEFLDAKSRLFLNTNIPFSAFICGVQGSGKSHTTSCIMENALIPSNNLGKLEKPLSALVFSYGHFSGDGEGYTISEAAFLAAPHAKMPGGAHVKKVTVLVSPSNYIRISKLYLRIPNVTVIPFMIKPRHLDIDIMLTLMNVNESDAPPLYMAQVTQILRQMASSGGPFDYLAFKKSLKSQKFNPAQENMLDMRLNLLESFLDLKGTCAEPQFRPGEITIMDMSCPFIDPNTACILFRIGLQRYLQSYSSGKMIVLDEAHKYMLPVPGAKALNESLLQTIRLQRHFGARVIISTQEPTLLTDLIALCSIAFIHRFSSPEWLSAIKRHIPMSAQAASTLMNKIEGLKTGTALLYSSNALLGWNDDEQLIKGTGKMLKVNIRKRITSDGGQSIMAV